MKLGFLGTPLLSRVDRGLYSRSGLCITRTILPACTLAGGTKMIQSPDSDGPPSLGEYLGSQRQRVGAQGAPMALGTGRANIAAFSGDSAAAALSALKEAKTSLGADAQLCHCTVSLDVDLSSVGKALQEDLGAEAAVLGRTVNKNDVSGGVEILLLRSDSPGGIKSASSTVTAAIDGGLAAANSACTAALSEATAGALGKLDAASPCTFLIFAHSPGAAPNAARQAIAAASGGAVAYGGPAIGDAETGAGWAMLGLPDAGNKNVQAAVVAAVPGSLSFLLSAVVKNWAQPVYVEPLALMLPKYVGDPAIDLLTAIRYDDWDKFLWCIEERGVDVNHKWADKQNQTPLLAACSRLRSRMVAYLLEHGADVHHRNDGGYTAAIYTRSLENSNREAVNEQLRLLESAGANTQLTEEEVRALKSNHGRVVE